jgi:hypothetical protein
LRNAWRRRAAQNGPEQFVVRQGRRSHVYVDRTDDATVLAGKPVKERVGPCGLEPQTFTVSIPR